MRPVFHWNLGSRSLELGKRTLIMGIVNVTPDSFSDGGEFVDPDNALKHALRLLDQGADIVDVGGESTRPGARVEAAEGVHSEHLSPAPTVSAEAELKRVVPVITDLKKRCPAAVISVDTYKSTVARAAVNAGAEIVNDVSGFHWDSQMISTLADLQCGAVLMHMRGRPEQWRNLPPPEDVVSLVKGELQQWAKTAVSAGVQRGRIVLDPGFGFGKNIGHNLELMNGLSLFHSLGCPLVVGASRKRTIGALSAEAPTDQRLGGSIAFALKAAEQGAQIVRVHDVFETVQALRIWRGLRDQALTPRL